MNNDFSEVLGTVAMVPKGEYDSTAYYEYLNVVEYEGSTYMAKQAVNNVPPTNEEFWMGIGFELKKGSSLNRPSNPYVGLQYFDTTLGIPIWFDGGKWINANGEEVN